MVDVTKSFYKVPTNGKISYQLLPDYQNTTGYKKATKSEVEAEIARATPLAQSDSWYKNYLNDLQQGIKLGVTQPSAYAIDPKTQNLTTKNALLEQQTQQEGIKAGTEKMIGGTAENPLTVPVGSAGYKLLTGQETQAQQGGPGAVPSVYQEVINERAGGARGTTQQYKVQAGDTLSAIAKKYGVSIADITGYKSGNANLIFPGENLTIGGKSQVGGQTPVTGDSGASGGGLGIGVGGGDLGGETTPKSPYDQLVEKLTGAISGGTGATGGAVSNTRETIGDFNTEINKAQDLLADLDQRIRGGVAKEAGRLAPMELITGRQEELERDASLQRNDLLGVIDSLTRGKTNVLEELALDQSERGLATQELSSQANVLSTLKGLENKPEYERYIDLQGGLYDPVDKEWIVNPQPKTTDLPSSYKEWQLAGGEKGTGKSFADWISSTNVKPATVSQQTVATYAARIEQANPIINNLEESITKMNPITFETQIRAPSYLQGADVQSYMQAARNFVNAVLRRESGAVISPSEFSNAYNQYLPRPGDSEETLQQKKTNRDIVYQSFVKGSGSAYQSVKDLLGEEDSDPLGLGF